MLLDSDVKIDTTLIRSLVGAGATRSAPMAGSRSPGTSPLGVHQPQGNGSAVSTSQDSCSQVGGDAPKSSPGVLWVVPDMQGPFSEANLLHWAQAMEISG